MTYTGAMILVIIASVAYHLFARSIPPDVHPLLALVVTYLVAALAALLLMLVFPLQAGLGASLRQVNWTSIGLGVAVLGIEVGFLLAYRAGWNISLAPLVAIAATTIILIPIGVLALKERMGPPQIIGLILTVIGLILITRR
jgi:uncharacterized membrane protein